MQLGRLLFVEQIALLIHASEDGVFEIANRVLYLLDDEERTGPVRPKFGVSGPQLIKLRLQIL